MRIVQGVGRGVWAGLLTVAPMGPFILIPALLVPGRETVLPRAAILLGACTMAVIVGKVAMALFRPASLAVRARPMVAGKAARQPLIDAIGLVGFLAYLMAWFAFLSLDAGWLRLLPPPPAWAMVAGLAALIAGNAVTTLAVWQNAFAAPAIEAQAGQHVVDTGLYGVVRHPLYAGNLLFYVGCALWMGSLAALAGVAVILAATLARVGIEERFLRTILPDYEVYARRVRARLIPFVI
jgi:protein-S-isoprenylcysteine O-methyltransferase Ste14